MASEDAVISWQQMDLEGIEPFTMILWSGGLLYEGRWDGQHRHTCGPDATKAHTWSSVTLYDEAVIDRRREWFARWREQYPQPAMEDVLQYHLTGGDGDTHHDLRMNRDNRMLTVSITVMELSPGECRMRYLDLQAGTDDIYDFTNKPSIHDLSSSSQAFLHKAAAP
jgi:hypothetical protein